jgi:peptidyl-prolyl cis-trans isomerase D
LRQAIRLALPGLYPDGRFIGQQAYADLLARLDLTIPEFESSLRSRILAERLLDVVAAGVVVTPADAERTFRRDHTRFRLRWVKLAPKARTLSFTPSPAEVKAYYDSNLASFQIPEQRKVTILILDLAKMQETSRPSYELLEQQYRQNIDQYRVPESIDFRQILVADPATAAKIEQQLVTGSDFAALAKKYSEDSDSARNGGEYQGLRPEQLQPALAKVLLSLKPGEVAGPVKTSYGYVIVQMEHHYPARVRPFSGVKDELAGRWKQQQVAAIAQGAVTKAVAELRENPENPEKVAHQFHMEIVHVNAYEAGQNIPQVGVNSDVYGAVASLSTHGGSEPLSLSADRSAIVVLDKDTPSRRATLGEVRDRIREILAQDHASTAAFERAEAVLDKAKADGSTWQPLRQSMGLKPTDSEPVERLGVVPGLGPLLDLGDALDRPQGALFGPVGVAGDIVAGKVIEKLPPVMTTFASQRNTILQQLRLDETQARQQLFEAGLRKGLESQGKLRVNTNAVDSVVRELTD